MKREKASYRISKDIALFLLTEGIHMVSNDSALMCKEYGDDQDWTEVTPDDAQMLVGDEYKTFAIWPGDPAIRRIAKLKHDYYNL